MIDLPILYLSRYITHNKSKYYDLIQCIRDNEGNNEKDWQNWILFMLKGIEQTSKETVLLIQNIKILMDEYKVKIREKFGTKYSHELLNNLFNHPYTKIEYIERDLDITRATAAKYLDDIVELGLLSKLKMGKSNYYINDRLTNLFINQAALYK